MSELTVNDDLGYPIVIGSGLHGEVAELVRKRGGAAVLICDSNRHVAAIAGNLAAAIGNPPVLSQPLNERRKSLRTVEEVLEGFLAAGVERDSLVVGVGGGIASDVFGFACATYMRGIKYAHVATSLVGMVDAAIGGKTGVNLSAGKNLAGAFHDPVGVFCDVGALQTLPARSLREGFAEIAKAAIIEGGEFFELLEELAPHSPRKWPWSAVIAQAIKVKTMSVADDRLERGAREVLNLGHTFAHAVERASAYRVSHGQAVGLGLRGAGLLALQTGRFSESEHLRVLTLLALFGLPLQTSLPVEELLAGMRHDKKRRQGRQRFVLPRAIGDVEYGVECAPASVAAVVRRLRQPPESFRARR